jgi:hypothetical protein
MKTAINLQVPIQDQGLNQSQWIELLLWASYISVIWFKGGWWTKVTPYYMWSQLTWSSRLFCLSGKHFGLVWFVGRFIPLLYMLPLQRHKINFEYKGQAPAAHCYLPFTIWSLWDFQKQNVVTKHYRWIFYEPHNLLVTQKYSNIPGTSGRVSITLE